MRFCITVTSAFLRRNRPRLPTRFISLDLSVPDDDILTSKSGIRTMNINTRYISSSAVYILATAVLLTLFFEFWRFVLMLFSHELAGGVPGGVLLQSVCNRRPL